MSSEALMWDRLSRYFYYYGLPIRRSRNLKPFRRWGCSMFRVLFELLWIQLQKHCNVRYRYLNHDIVPAGLLRVSRQFRRHRDCLKLPVRFRDIWMRLNEPVPNSFGYNYVDVGLEHHEYLASAGQPRSDRQTLLPPVVARQIHCSSWVNK
jgi:hypothetical protein